MRTSVWSRSFTRWLDQARQDYNLLISHRDPRGLAQFARKRFSATLDESRLNWIPSGTAAAGAALGFPPEPVKPTKPAGFA